MRARAYDIGTEPAWDDRSYESKAARPNAESSACYTSSRSVDAGVRTLEGPSWWTPTEPSEKRNSDGRDWRYRSATGARRLADAAIERVTLSASRVEIALTVAADVEEPDRLLVLPCDVK